MPTFIADLRMRNLYLAGWLAGHEQAIFAQSCWLAGWLVMNEQAIFAQSCRIKSHGIG
jgi:hypothetical protein